MSAAQACFKLLADLSRYPDINVQVTCEVLLQTPECCGASQQAIREFLSATSGWTLEMFQELYTLTYLMMD
jgi:hypothetical protein